ncbi:hypothetical protein HanOQP8_Chr15g0596111 [Helianthus annuus]|nr:hypothetical protein HanHA89_Chr15g0638801 [Helianthus annuus]KAJ0650783.1 hypothetical protein HanLR1_Chr15g0599661 [Helianthus annuus]KAJ0654537.1 hypothetical protein HanOQP8_Chr15g0596111 [Helianthus annuus]
MLNDEVLRIDARKGSTTAVLAAPSAPIQQQQNPTQQQQPQASDPTAFSSRGRGRGRGSWNKRGGRGRGSGRQQQYSWAGQQQGYPNWAWWTPPPCPYPTQQPWRPHNNQPTASPQPAHYAAPPQFHGQPDFTPGQSATVLLEHGYHGYESRISPHSGTRISKLRRLYLDITAPGISIHSRHLNFHLKLVILLLLHFPGMIGSVTPELKF